MIVDAKNIGDQGRLHEQSRIRNQTDDLRKTQVIETCSFHLNSEISVAVQSAITDFNRTVGPGSDRAIDSYLVGPYSRLMKSSHPSICVTAIVRPETHCIEIECVKGEDRSVEYLALDVASDWVVSIHDRDKVVTERELADKLINYFA